MRSSRGLGLDLAPHAAFGWTAPVIAINCLRAIHRFDSAKSVTTCAVFLASLEPHLHQAKLALDDAKRMLDLRAHARRPRVVVLFVQTGVPDVKTFNEIKKLREAARGKVMTCPW